MDERKDKKIGKRLNEEMCGNLDEGVVKEIM